MIIRKSDREIELIRECGKIGAKLFEKLENYIKPGVKTKDINRIVEDFLRSFGAVPAFKGYREFPAASCVSIDNEVVHGVPGERVLEEGQIVSIDVGVAKNSYVSDSAVTFPVGKISDEKMKLLEVTKKSLEAGIQNAKEGNRVHDISSAVQEVVESAGFSVVRDLAGHGVGINLHEEPDIPNFGVPHTGRRLFKGMVIAIEPMVNMGSYEIKTLNDGWTVLTVDGKPSAHFEHTVAITDGEPDILT